MISAGEQLALNNALREVRDAVKAAMKAGFYVAHAMCGVSIEQCDENWVKYDEGRLND
jgi:hypothetical protein